jgi:hypothetical protein
LSNREKSDDRISLALIADGCCFWSLNGSALPVARDLSSRGK